MATPEGELIEVNAGNTLSALDGRDWRFVKDLSPHLSEKGLQRNRARVEARWLMLLSEVLPDLELLSYEPRAILEGFVDGTLFTDEVFNDVKAREAVRGHDVTSLVRALGAYYDNATPLLKPYLRFNHFAMTSEDVTNLAEGLALSDARSNILLPQMNEIQALLDDDAFSWADIPMLGRTHGQAATPTTLGKEFAVFAEDYRRETDKFASVSLTGKFGGATGGLNALRAAYPEFNWRRVAKDFVESFGLEYVPATTQIESHYSTIDYLQTLGRSGIVLLKLSGDIWEYISRDMLTLKAEEGQDGSSTMPNKVNPIDFEKVEANVRAGQGMISTLARELPVSRMQRDLSDSSLKRTLPVAIGHELVAMRSLKNGLAKIGPNHTGIAQDLNEHWDILAEPLQIIMKRDGIDGSYDIIKEKTQGVRFLENDWHELVEAVIEEAPELSEQARADIRALRPEKYTGYSAEIARREPIEDAV